MLCIVANTIVLSLVNIISDASLQFISDVFNFLFFGEMGLKIYAFGTKYTEEKFNIFDALINCLSIVEMTVID